MKLSEFAKECRDTWKEDRSGVPVVGLEHLEPGEVKLSIWDVDSENTFTKRFNKGQVLLGRRRVYLRKAVVAPFDGICSGDITVIEAVPGKILPELLPFVIQNDAFFDYAEQGSAGSLSPRVKWEHLKDFEVNLPSIDEQKVLAEKLWAAYRLKESYKKLLAATDEMVKSRFIEMFEGNILAKQPLHELLVLGPQNGFYRKDAHIGGEVPIVKMKELFAGDEICSCDCCDKVSLSPDEKCRFVLTEEDLLFGRRSLVPEGAGKCVRISSLCKTMVFESSILRIRLNTNLVTPLYIQYWLKTPYGEYEMSKLRSGTTVIGIKGSDLKNMQVPVPPIELQREFESVYNQADKSGFELRKSIENIDAVIKSLINN